MEETVVYISDNMRCWNSPKPGMWKFGTYLGKIMVTNKRLLFLSSGSSKMGSIMAAHLLAGGILGPLIIGKSLTRDLELEALNNEGSFALPFNEITHIDSVRRWDFAAYLTVHFKGEARSFLKDPFGMSMGPMMEISELVEIEQLKPENKPPL